MCSSRGVAVGVRARGARAWPLHGPGLARGRVYCTLQNCLTFSYENTVFSAQMNATPVYRVIRTGEGWECVCRRYVLEQLPRRRVGVDGDFDATSAYRQNTEPPLAATQSMRRKYSPRSSSHTFPV